MDFREYGFQTGKVLLPGLDLEVKLGPNQFFRNDGFVEDIVEHTNEIYREFKCPNDAPEKPSLFGRCLSISNPRYKFAIVFAKSRDEPNDQFVWAHESTHAAMRLGFKKEFLTLLKVRGFNLNPFKKYCDEEAIANVGGLLGLYVAFPLVQYSFLDESLISLWKDMRESRA